MTITEDEARLVYDLACDYEWIKKTIEMQQLASVGDLDLLARRKTDDNDLESIFECIRRITGDNL